MADLRFLLVDDDPLLLRLVAEGLERLDGVQVVGRVTSGREALSLLDSIDGDIDVLLLDVAMPGMTGPQCALEALAMFPNITVVMLTSFNREGMLSDSIRAGAKAFLTKETSASEIVDAAERAMRGEMVLGSRPMDLVVSSYLNGAPKTKREEDFLRAFNSMSPRLKEVVVQIAQGRSNRAIASEMCLSVSTVKGYVSDILRLTQCDSRGQIGTVAVRLGLAN